MRRSRENYRGNAVEKVELTDREAQTLALVCRGYTNAEIARDMGISENTVKARLAIMMAVAGVSTKLRLLIWGLENPDAFQRGVATLREHGRECDCCMCVIRWPRAA